MKFNLRKLIGDSEGNFRVINGDEVLIESVKGSLEEIGVLIAVNFGDKYFGCEIYDNDCTTANKLPVLALAEKDEFDEDAITVASKFLTYRTRERNGLFRVETDEHGAGHVYDTLIGSQTAKDVEISTLPSTRYNLMRVELKHNIYEIFDAARLTDEEKDVLLNLVKEGKAKAYESSWEAWAYDEAMYRVGEEVGNTCDIYTTPEVLNEAIRLMADIIMEEAESFEGPKSFLDHDRLDRFAKESVKKARQRKVYTESLETAIANDETSLYHASNQTNIECAQAIDKAIVDSNYELYHYDLKAAAKAVIEQYGEERVSWVLAATLQRMKHDGRFSQANKNWAHAFDIPETERCYFLLNTHPCVMDGFANVIREAKYE